MNVLSFKGKIPNTKHFVTSINIRYWDWKMTYRAQAVYADDPKVLEVFEKQGIPRFDPETDEIYKAEKVNVPEQQKEQVSTETKEPEQEQKEVDWRELGWVEMRSLAASVTDEPIKNKETAVRVLENHFNEEDK